MTPGIQASSRNGADWPAAASFPIGTRLATTTIVPQTKTTIAAVRWKWRQNIRSARAATCATQCSRAKPISTARQGYRGM